MYDFINVMGHIEVYKNDEFLFSADTEEEAIEVIEETQKGVERICLI